jgi:hypothetical protein
MYTLILSLFKKKLNEIISLCIILLDRSVFGFLRQKIDLEKSVVWPILVNEINERPTVFKKKTNELIILLFFSTVLYIVKFLRQPVV